MSWGKGGEGADSVRMLVGRGGWPRGRGGRASWLLAASEVWDLMLRVDLGCREVVEEKRRFFIR